MCTPICTARAVASLRTLQEKVFMGGVSACRGCLQCCSSGQCWLVRMNVQMLTSVRSVVPPSTLEQAGTMSVCRSAAWQAKVVTSAYWVHAPQVSKVRCLATSCPALQGWCRTSCVASYSFVTPLQTAPSGEYLTTGSFMIRGKKNFLPPVQLLMGLGMLFRVEESFVERHQGERGGEKKGETVLSEGATNDCELPCQELLDSSVANFDNSEGDEDEDDNESNETDHGEESNDESDADYKEGNDDCSMVEKACNNGGGAREDSVSNDTDEDEPAAEQRDTTDTRSAEQHVRRAGEKAPNELTQEELLEVTIPSKYKVSYSADDWGDDDDNADSDEEARGGGRKRRISAKERRLMRKGGGGTQETQRVKAPSKKKEEVVPLPRGRKGKIKKMKKKYRDQDEEEKAVVMELLQVFYLSSVQAHYL